ncbi:MAG: protein adenylyltransferase SelO family protein, partial [Gammaproteobacteria bacterium]
IATQFPAIAAAHPDGGPMAYVALFDEVTERTARLMADWMRVGFVHGVTNTDNLSILGLTIDYGPYGWLEDFNPDWTPNTTDGEGRRYRYGNQPSIAHWNLLQLANALYPVIGEAAPLEAILRAYPDRYRGHWQNAMAAKLGLLVWAGEADNALADDLQTLLQAAETDMTIWFRALAGVTPDLSDEAALDALRGAFYGPAALMPDLASRWHAWLARYRQRLAADGRPDAERAAAMKRVNPRYVLRNYLAQLAIDAAEGGDFSLIRTLLTVLRRPFDEQPEHAAWAGLRPDWARTRVGCSMLSCSS